jgi:hypothetical protein
MQELRTLCQYRYILATSMVKTAHRQQTVVTAPLYPTIEEGDIWEHEFMGILEEVGRGVPPLGFDGAWLENSELRAFVVPPERCQGTLPRDVNQSWTTTLRSALWTSSRKRALRLN